MRQGIEKWLPNDIDKILDWLETCRSRLKSKYSFVGYSAALKALASTAIEKDRVLDEEEFCDIIEGTAENM